MPTVELTSTPTQIDDGSAATISVTNNGPGDVRVNPFSQRITPGRSQEFTPTGVAVTLQSLGANPASAVYTKTAKPADPIFATLSGTYAASSRLLASAFAGGRYVGFCGDSITVGTGATNSTNTAYVPMAVKTAGAAYVKAYNGGVASDTSALLLARMDTILAQGVNALHVMIGTNDAAQAVPLATYVANVQAIVAKARAAALPIQLSTVPPYASSASAATHLLVSTYNLWLRLWCPVNGIPLVDAHGVLTDPLTGFLASGFDGGQAPHPNDAGHLALGKAVGASLVTLGRTGTQPLPPWPVWGPAATRGFGLLVNPLVNTTANWSGVASGSPTSVTAAASTGTDGLPRGNWLSIRADNTAGGSTVTTQRGATIDATKWTVGDKLLAAFYAKSTDAAGTGLKVQILDHANTAQGVLLDTPGRGDPGPVFALFTVPSGPTALRLTLAHSTVAGADTTGSIGAADVFNLTTLGLTSYIS